MNIIKVYSYGRIQKFEISTLIKGVNAIVKKYDTVALDIKIWCDLLLDQESELGEITEINRTHPAMKDLKKYRTLLRNILSVLNTHLSALKRAQVSTLSPQQEVVVPFLDRSIRNIVTSNFKKVEEKVIQMIHEVEQNSELQAALEVVGLKVYFDELKLVHNNVALCKMKMVTFKSETPKMRTAAIKSSSVKALTNLIRSINLAIIKYPEKDYNPMTNELNVFLGEYQSLDKSRRTMSKKSAEIKKTAALS